jgi:hypothetical protein
MFLFILLLCCFSSSVGALLLYNTEPKFKLLVDVNLFGSKGIWEPLTPGQVKKRQDLQVIDMSVCDDKYGKEYEYSIPNLSVGGDTQEEARENGSKRVCAYAANTSYGILKRDICRERARELTLSNWGSVNNIEPYVDGIKEMCISVLPNENYA